MTTTMMMTTTTMRMRNGALIVALALVAGCSSLRLDVDHDLSADFAGYSTYRWATRPPTKDGGPPQDDLQLRRVRDALETELDRRGLAPAGAGDPDVLVRYRYDHGDRWSPGPPASVAVGYGAWPGAAVGYGVPYGYRYATAWGPVYDDGPIVRPVWRISVELIDAKTERVIWHGVAEDVVDRGDTPQQRAERIRLAIAGLLGRYPPRG